MTAMLSRPTKVAAPPTFSALCARCNDFYPTTQRKAPWLCPNCSKAPVTIRVNQSLTWADAINPSWGAGS